jgi:hypothetical protein
MYNRHQVKGFQRTVKNDLYYVEEQLQEYDKDLFIMWNPTTNEHLIMDDVVKLAVMRIPQRGFETLDSRVVAHMKKIHTANGFNATWELNESEARREREQEQKLKDMSDDYAKEMKPALQELATTGRIDGVKKYHGGVSLPS